MKTFTFIYLHVGKHEVIAKKTESEEEQGKIMIKKMNIFPRKSSLGKERTVLLQLSAPFSSYLILMIFYQ